MAACAGLALPWLGLAVPASASVAGGGSCSAGAHTLAPPGSHVYPETGNGGYTSLHTLVHLVYDASHEQVPAGQPGGAHRPGHPVPDQLQPRLRAAFRQHQRRPDMTVSSVSINGHPARFRFVQPTYAGDPNGQDDPSPAAHEASQNNPVGGPSNNPLPPACAPELPNTDAAPDSLERHPVPGQQARDHAVGADHGTAPRSPSRSATPAGPACTTTGTAPRRAGSGLRTAAS